MATATAQTADEIRAQIAQLEKNLRAAEEAEAKAAQAGDAKTAIALLSAMRMAFREVERLYPGTFDAEKWAVAFSPQAWPRTGKLRRSADLSETEVKMAQDAGIEAVSKIRL